MDFLMDVRWWMLGVMAVAVFLNWFLTGRVVPGVLACGLVGGAVIVGAVLGDALGEAMKCAC